jgi:hypothetical protein
MFMNKLATGITAIAIATTAISVPAKADNKDIQTLLAILAGGLVINEIIDNKKDRNKSTTSIKRDDYKKPRDQRVTHQHSDGKWYTHRNMEEMRAYHAKKAKRARERARELAKREEERRKRDRLRIKSKRDDKRDRNPNSFFKLPIQDTVHTLPLPKQCRRTLHSRFGQKTHSLSRKCLRKNGYRVSKKGNVTHSDYRGISARPNLH